MPSIINVGLLADTEDYWEAEQPHPDSLRLAHTLANFLAERGHDDTPDLIDLANGLEHAFFMARKPVLSGRPLTLQCLTVIPGAVPTAADPPPAPTLDQALAEAYTTLSAMHLDAAANHQVAGDSTEGAVHQWHAESALRLARIYGAPQRPGGAA